MSDCLGLHDQSLGRYTFQYRRIPLNPNKQHQVTRTLCQHKGYHARQGGVSQWGCQPVEGGQPVGGVSQLGGGSSMTMTTTTTTKT